MSEQGDGINAAPIDDVGPLGMGFPNTRMPGAESVNCEEVARSALEVALNEHTDKEEG